MRLQNGDLSYLHDCTEFAKDNEIDLSVFDEGTMVAFAHASLNWENMLSELWEMGAVFSTSQDIDGEGFAIVYSLE
jgi:hypothetical protein